MFGFAERGFVPGIGHEAHFHQHAGDVGRLQPERLEPALQPARTEPRVDEQAQRSPLDEQRLYAGSGDGLQNFTHDGGKSWQRAELPGLPEFAGIHQVTASPADVNVAYAACNNFFAGDYAPYLYKTTDGGAHWISINANLPVRGSTWSIIADDVDPNLLFVGTMTGVTPRTGGLLSV